MAERRFEFRDGKSSKFWTIALDGMSHTVTFGRIGSAGQTQAKSFSSEEEARRSSEKLIAEKTRKGYAEVGESAGAAPGAAATPATRSTASTGRTGNTATAASGKAVPADPATTAESEDAPKRSLRLEPADWYRVTYVDRPPLAWDNPKAEFVETRLKDVAPEELVTRILQPNGKPVEQSMEWFSFHSSMSLALDFRQYVLPKLTADQKEKLREQVRTQGVTKTRKWADGSPQLSHPALFLAAALGIHGEVVRLVESWGDDYFSKPGGPSFFHYGIVFGLPNRELVIHHAKRLRMPIMEGPEIRAWLAHTGYSELEYAAEGIAPIPNKTEAKKTIKELARAEAPETARAMLIVYAGSKAKLTAREWMDAHRDWTVEALHREIAAGGPLKKEAEHLLPAFADVPPVPQVPSLPANAAAAPIAPATSTPPRRPATPRSGPQSIPEPRLRLEAVDLYRVTYADREPLALPPVSRPFDLQVCMEELKAFAGRNDYGYISYNFRSFEKLPLSPRLSREEAEFWFSVLMAGLALSSKEEKILAELETRDYNGVVSLPQLRKRMAPDRYCEGTLPLLRVLRDLLSQEELVELLGDIDAIPFNRDHMSFTPRAHMMLANGFEHDVAPFLRSEMRCELADRVRPWLQKSIGEWPQSHAWATPDPRFFYAAALGMHDEVLELVRSWPDELYQGKQYGKEIDVPGYRRPQDIVFGLGSRDLVVGEMKRLRLRLHQADYIRAWMAHTGTDELDYVAETIVTVGNKQDAARLAAELGRAEGAVTAPAMLRVYAESKAQPYARKWFEQHPEWTQEGLAPIARSGGKLAADAERMLLAIRPTPHVAVSAPAPAAPLPAPGPIAISGYCLPDGVERGLRLQPEDYRWITSRPFEPLPRPPRNTAPFDPEPATKVLEKKTWEPDWETWGLNPGMSAQEGFFWFSAMLFDHKVYWNHQVRAQLSKVNLDDLPSPAKAAGMMDSAASFDCPPEIIIALFAIHGLDGLTDLLLHPKALAPNRNHSLVIGFRRYVFPYLTPSERTAVIEKLRPAHKPAQWPKKTDQKAAPVYYLAAMLGMHDETRALVESWADRRYAKCEERTNEYYYQFPEEIVLGLGSEEEITRHMRRLEISILREAHLRGFLAHTEWRALDVAERALKETDTVSYSYSKTQELERTLGILGLVEAPETGELMWRATKERRTARAAKEWMEQHAVLAAAAMIPVAVGGGKLSGEALAFLRGFRSKGHGAAIDRAARAYGEKVAARIHQEVLRDYAAEAAACPPGQLPSWFLEAAAATNSPKLPAWLVVQQLPPLRLGGTDIGPAHVPAVLSALQSSTLDAPARLVEMLRQAVEPATRDAFAWKICADWLHEGAPSQDKWALIGVGLLGGDPSALKLAPLVRAWPGESQHQRAVLGLECLRAIGTDVALMQIHGIAQRVKFQALKKRAGECMEAVATSLGLSRDQLEDRIVPDCGLDERGTKTFDFGGRLFQLILRSDLKPYLRYPDGSLKTDLPKPTAKDDAAKAQSAAEEWKTTKKIVADAAKTQAKRLEQAMVTDRRWATGEFEPLLVRHPLTGILVRHFVWGAFDAKGVLLATFRIAEDGTYADRDDNPVSLDIAASVGLLHPFHLSDELKAAWGQMLAEYEILPPFPQLGREIHSLQEKETAAREITRFAGAEHPAKALIRSLDGLGWSRAVSSDGGSFTFHCKPFAASNVTAMIDYEPGACIDDLEDAEDQEITSLRFYPGAFTANDAGWGGEPVPLKEVSPVIISEALRDLYAATSKK